MSDKTQEVKQAAEDKYRAVIVRKLRAEAGRIEAGGSPHCYAIRCNEDDDTRNEHNIDVDEARDGLTLECDPDDGWPEYVESQEWGVCVTIEEVKRTEHRADLSNQFGEIFGVKLVDPDTYTGPDVMPQDCPVCEDEVYVEPDGVCPTCAKMAAEEGEGGEDE